MKLSRLQIVTALKERRISPSHKHYFKLFQEYVCEELKLNPKNLNNELYNTAKNIRQKFNAQGRCLSSRRAHCKVRKNQKFTLTKKNS